MATKLKAAKDVAATMTVLCMMSQSGVFGKDSGETRMRLKKSPTRAPLGTNAKKATIMSTPCSFTKIGVRGPGGYKILGRSLSCSALGETFTKSCFCGKPLL